MLKVSREVVMAGLAEYSREFFTRKPIWKFDAKS